MRATIVVQRTNMLVTVLIHGACGVTIVEVPMGQRNVLTSQRRDNTAVHQTPDDVQMTEYLGVDPSQGNAPIPIPEAWSYPECRGSMTF